MAAVALRQIRKTFGDTEIIRGVDLDIEAGEFCVFVGPSGCGKSTLLRLIAGLEDISAGELYLDGARANALAPAKRDIAMVFQSYALYPHMTVYENMAFGLSLARHGRDEIKSRVLRAAAILQLDPLLERKPKELSGGQRQRVAIGRAIVRKPKVFLFDEPLSNLDAALRVQMRIELSKLHAELKATMVYVTHDQAEAMTLADRIVVLNNGCVEQVGAPLDLYHRPRNRFVAGFIGSPRMNFIECRLGERSDGGARVTLPTGAQLTVAADTGGTPPDAQVTLGVRPEHFVLPTGGEADLVGKVVVLEHLGGETFAYVETPGTVGGLLTVRLPPDTPIREGETLRLNVPAQCAHLFDADGIAFPRGHGVATSSAKTQTRQEFL